MARTATAEAWPSLTAALKSASEPAPPQAITGTGTACATLRTSAMS